MHVRDRLFVEHQPERSAHRAARGLLDRGVVATADLGQAAQRLFDRLGDRRQLVVLGVRIEQALGGDDGRPLFDGLVEALS